MLLPDLFLLTKNITDLQSLYNVFLSYVSKLNDALQDVTAYNEFTITATGFTTTVTGTARYTIVDRRFVVLFIPFLSGTSNATTFTLTGIPTEIQPSDFSLHWAQGTDNSVNTLVLVRVNAASATWDLFKGEAVAAWTASGIKQINRATIVYYL